MWVDANQATTTPRTMGVPESAAWRRETTTPVTACHASAGDRDGDGGEAGGGGGGVGADLT